jgi:outer membrane lipoprotein-sorting protein
MKTPFRLLFVIIAVFVSAAASHAASDVEQVIAKARATVGSEAALKSLESLHYTGTLTTTAKEPDGTNRDVKVGIEIVFQRPYRQRIVATSENKIEITALDDYEGWQREQDPSDSTRWRMTLLSTDQIKRLRANTWENLSFFQGIEKRRGTVNDLGKASIDGKSCRKLSFDHGDGIVFTRYFDEASGRLLLTETENGITIREEGEMLVDGIRFPRKIISTSKLTDGGERTVSITFDKIVVNEPLADSLFSVPSMGR